MKSSAEQHAPIDSFIDVVTPENVSFQYEIAGPFRRMLALLIDMTIIVIFMVLLVFILYYTVIFGEDFLNFSVGIFLIIYFMVVFFYFGLFETFWNGQTPGKRILHLRVITIAGQPINALQAIARNLLRIVDAVPSHPHPIFFFYNTYLIGFFTMSVNRRYQRLGDLACGTMVIVEKRSWLYGLKQLRHPAIVELASEIPANYEVSRSLGQALAAYVDRRDLFTINRRADLARHIGRPLVAKFGLPSSTNYDLLLCALYYRTFDSQAEERSPAEPAEVAFGSSPFDFIGK